VALKLFDRLPLAARIKDQRIRLSLKFCNQRPDLGAEVAFIILAPYRLSVEMLSPAAACPGLQYHDTDCVTLYRMHRVKTVGCPIAR
jgi:hypothetical protein